MRRWWALVAMLAIAGIVAMFLFRAPDENDPDVRESSRSGSAPSPTSSTPIDPRRATVLAPDTKGFVQWPGAAAATAALNRPDASAREDIDTVQVMLADYVRVFGAVPEGGLNEEITRGLRGDNAKKIVFLAEKPGLTNATGELLDRWGTPYFFHKLSGQRIDLRSAGPDRKPWTADDVFDATEGEPPL